MTAQSDISREGEMTEWQPIETAPKDRRGCLLVGRYPTNTGWSDPYFGFWDEHDQLWTRWPHGFEPTHWLPLPPLPPPPSKEPQP